MKTLLQLRKEAEARRVEGALSALDRQRRLVRSRRDLILAAAGGAVPEQLGRVPEPVPTIARMARECHDPVVRHAFRTLVAAVAARADRMLESSAAEGDGGYVLALARLAETYPLWRRPVEAWRPASKNPGRQFASLARHLLADYRVPAVMDALFFTRDRQVSPAWFHHVGTGGNIRTAPGLPVPLTKRMAHCAAEAPEESGFIQALRWGQVTGLGGAPRLARAVMATQLGRQLWAPDGEAWWLTVIHWFVNQSMLDLVHVGPIVDFLEARRFGSGAEDGLPDAGFSMKGRTPAALLRLVAEWHEQINRARRQAAAQNRTRATAWQPPERFAPSGIGGGRWEFGKEKQRCVWTIHEIVTFKALAEEGQAMRHCVATYAGSIAQGRSAIWSLRVTRAPLNHPERALTIQVDRPSRTIVQCRGRLNRLPTPDEERILMLWAAQQDLRVQF